MTAFYHPTNPGQRVVQSSPSTAEDQDQREGLLPVVKFLQGALSLKTKVCVCVCVWVCMCSCTPVVLIFDWIPPQP